MGSAGARSTSALVIALTAASLGGCAHIGTAAGDVDMGPMIVANTTVLHVSNQYRGDMRIYRVIGGKERYLGKVAALSARDFVMDPELVGEAGISFSAREPHADESTSISRGPYLIDQGRVIEFPITARDVEGMRRPIAPVEHATGAVY
jgi:hypothetical protein